jgi:hypothetical protein
MSLNENELIQENFQEQVWEELPTHLQVSYKDQIPM